MRWTLHLASNARQEITRQPFATGHSATGVTYLQLVIQVAPVPSPNATQVSPASYPPKSAFQVAFSLPRMDCLLSLDALNRPPRHPPAPTHASAAAVLRTLSHLLHKAVSGALSPVHTVQQQPNGILGPALLSLAALTLSAL